MKYMGSKRRIAKEILPLMLKNRKEGQYFVEPFCGGCNSLDKVENPRIGNDSNKYLVSFLKYLQEEIPFEPEYVTETEYKEIQNNKDKFPEWLVGYVGFNLSFAAKFFGGYARDKVGTRDHQLEAQRCVLRQQDSLQGIEFYSGSYNEFPIPENSIIYCDPPYKDTTKYNKNSFDYESFYDWCREKKAEGHTVFVSEFYMPEDFTVIWEKEINNNLDVNRKNGKRGIEKLFTL